MSISDSQRAALKLLLTSPAEAEAQLELLGQTQHAALLAVVEAGRLLLENGCLLTAPNVALALRRVDSLRPDPESLEHGHLEAAPVRAALDLVKELGRSWRRPGAFGDAGDFVAAMIHSGDDWLLEQMIHCVLPSTFKEDERLEHLFDVVRELSLDGAALNFSSLVLELEEREDLDDLGGVEFVREVFLQAGGFTMANLLVPLWREWNPGLVRKLDAFLADADFDDPLLARLFRAFVTTAEAGVGNTQRRVEFLLSLPRSEELAPSVHMLTAKQ